MRRSIMLAAGAIGALAAGPAFAQAAYPAITGGGAYEYDYDFGIDDTGVDYADEGYVEDYAPPPPPPRHHARHQGHSDGAYGDRPLPPQPGEPQFAYSHEQREDWLRECRRRYDGDRGLGGALIGGAIGGFAGNRIAGDGNRVVGTVAGAAVGALAGGAIDRAGDDNRARDICEDYLVRYEGQAAGYGASHSGGYAPGPVPYGAGYAYSGPVMWVPMIVGWDCEPKTRVAEEWVDQPARRAIPRKTKLVPAKGKTVPIKTQPTKTRPIKATPVKTTKRVK